MEKATKTSKLITIDMSENPEAQRVARSAPRPARAKLCTLLAFFTVLFARPVFDMPLSTVLVSFVIGGLLIWIAHSDMQRLVIPDTAVLGLASLAIVIAFVFDDRRYLEHLVAGVAAFVILWLVGEIHFRLRGIDGLGFGDAKLAGVLGLLLGFSGILSVFLIATISGFLSGLVLRARVLPFGLFLSVSGWVVWLYGPLHT